MSLIDLARAAATAAKIDPALVCATVEQESGWNVYAVRYEPAFRAKYVAPKNLAPLEEVTRSMSWGLMQVMGENAREHGFKGAFLSQLIDAATGLAWGCEHLAHCLKLTGHAIPALQMWNGGKNKQYAGQVLARMATYAPKAAPQVKEA